MAGRPDAGGTNGQTRASTGDQGGWREREREECERE
jgi:hypothetical protein